jgi:hypothetical protein
MEVGGSNPSQVMKPLVYELTGTPCSNSRSTLAGAVLWSEELTEDEDTEDRVWPDRWQLEARPESSEAVEWRDPEPDEPGLSRPGDWKDGTK